MAVGRLDAISRRELAPSAELVQRERRCGLVRRGGLRVHRAEVHNSLDADGETRQLGVVATSARLARALAIAARVGARLALLALALVVVSRLFQAMPCARLGPLRSAVARKGLHLRLAGGLFEHSLKNRSPITDSTEVGPTKRNP